MRAQVDGKLIAVPGALGIDMDELVFGETSPNWAGKMMRAVLTKRLEPGQQQACGLDGGKTVASGLLAELAVARRALRAENDALALR